MYAIFVATFFAVNLLPALALPIYNRTKEENRKEFQKTAIMLYILIMVYSMSIFQHYNIREIFIAPALHVSFLSFCILTFALLLNFLCQNIWYIFQRTLPKYTSNIYNVGFAILITCIVSPFFSLAHNYLASPCPPDSDRLYTQTLERELNRMYTQGLERELNRVRNADTTKIAQSAALTKIRRETPRRRDDGTLSHFAVVHAAEKYLPAGPERDRILEAGKDIRESVFWTLLSH